ncbi:MAG: sensor histidine kinase, partial [Chloroflexi bacterium]|nr:sensor histidine kinase [Chloroflexota bacterium]
VILDVGDDGLGFDLAAPRENGHYGLSGMNERAALCGGELKVSSKPGKGTAVRLTVPA